VWVALLGCSPSQAPGHAAKVRAKVNLPETPSLEIPVVVSKHADGAWTVAGLRLEASEGRWAESVQVRGVVLDRQVCPLQRRRNADPCGLAPHLLIADSLDKPGQPLLITGTNEQIHGLPEGGDVSVVGRHVQWSDDRHFVDSRGIVQIPAPPGDEAAD
jgi:hypothetical protein